MKLQHWTNKVTGRRWTAYHVRIEYQVTRGVLIASLAHEWDYVEDWESLKARIPLMQLAKRYLREHGEPNCGSFDDAAKCKKAADIVDAIFPELGDSADADHE